MDKVVVPTFREAPGGRTMRPVSLAAIVLGMLLVAAANRLRADEIRWRQSYADAYQESQKTGKPMFMEFGSEGCFWCKKLEANTLSNADIAKLVNEKFIPVKIDAQNELDLCRAVGVQSLPTLFVLAPDRTILNRYDGYAEAEPILLFLRQGLERCPPPADKK
jgi:thioredoxin-related protein